MLNSGIDIKSAKTNRVGVTDGLLMQKVKEGDFAQAAILFHRHHCKIYHYLGKMSGDYHLAEDLTQNVFEKLIMHRNSFDVDRNFEGWIYRIARNVFLDHVDQRKKMPIQNIDRYISEMHVTTEPTTDHDQENKLHKALDALSVDDRELLIWTRFKKMKYHEVAKLLGTTESNIKVKVFRAIEKLRTLFFQLESN